MIIIYDRKTREIIGVSMIAQDNSGLTRKPSMKNVLRTDRLNPNLMEFQVTDDETIANEIYKYDLKFSSSGEPKELVKKITQQRSLTMMVMGYLRLKQMVNPRSQSPQAFATKKVKY